MKRILCLIESLGSGGAERQLSGLAVMLKRQGYDVEVGYYIKKEFYLPHLKDNGVTSSYLPMAASAKKRFFVLRKHIHKRNPDVVISYSPATSMITGLLKAFGSAYKLIVSERNTTQSLSKHERRKFFFYRWADIIVPNSYAQSAFIKGNYPKFASKIDVITNFVDTEFFFPIEEYSCHKPCSIICVGRDNPQKNLLRFLDALKLLVDEGAAFHVDWFGSFESSYGLRCKNRIKDLGLEDYITLKGETKNVRDEYRKHDVFCLPSIYEGFPNVLCEAMSCGLPVICSNVCDNPTIVQDGVNGLLFDPNNTEDMAKSIEKMILTPISEKIRISAANREKSISMFSEDAFLAKYKRLF